MQTFFMNDLYFNARAHNGVNQYKCLITNKINLFNGDNEIYKTAIDIIENTVNPFKFVCLLFCEFRDLVKNRKIKWTSKLNHTH